ncbi:hypothetical protein NX059_002628 [Plenodomus lindquistii]|nr:hypothetical protein NX059_009263 [Plenodomus lindquistii]KAI8936157.1 hypothetical protein NX059_007652 [Plenodomus lindquistii]KAI8939780.1 hypothetical protein NX059_003521 [Plenodomus lindquistii]KAI8941405.1 hypothetical protein NX059_002628 [Plenodomus lindquistii]
MADQKPILETDTKSVAVSPGLGSIQRSNTPMTDTGDSRVTTFEQFPTLPGSKGPTGDRLKPREPKKQDLSSSEDELYRPLPKKPQPRPAEHLSDPVAEMMAKAIQMLSQGQSKLTQAPFPSEYLPSFDGSDITVFLERYEEVALHYGFSESEKVRRVITYCKERQKQIIRYSIEYQDALEDCNWTSLQIALRKRFRSNDTAQQEESAAHLEQWLRDCQSRPDLNIKEYLEEFQIKIERCIASEEIERNKKGYYLVKGLPIHQATKVLQKFNLSTKRPRDFSFEKISSYLSARIEIEEEAKRLNPTEATKKFSPDHQFNTQKVVEIKLPSFSQPTLQYPKDTQAPKTHRIAQSPPGVPASQSEVDMLSDKLFQLQLSKADLISVQWTPRESELLANHSIATHVKETAGERLAKAQAQDKPPQNHFQQPNLFQRPSGQQTQGTSQNQPPRLPFTCFVCNKQGHGKAECPSINQLTEKGWCHWNENRMLFWGTPNNPQGRVTGLGNQGWLETIIAHIKRTWIKQDLSPFAVKAPWLEDSSPPVAIQNNSVVANLNPDTDSGSISAEDYQAFWDASHSAIAEDNDLYAIQAAQIEHKSITRKTVDRRALGDPKVQKPKPDSSSTVPKAILRRAEKDQPIQPRGRRDLVAEGNKPQEAEQVWPMDEEMIDNALEKTFAKKAPVPRKIRFAEGIPPTTNEVIASILSATVSMPVGTLIGNMPEVRKKLFRNTYSKEELDKEYFLQANATRTAEEDSEDEEDHRPILGSVSVVNAAAIPDYVLVEASSSGSVSQCYSMTATDWEDPEINRVQASIESSEEDRQELELVTARRRYYDKQAGVEHIRRDCPKVPVTIGGKHFLSLLDTGAELNTVRRETADEAQLPISTLPREMKNAKMVSANGSTGGFSGIVWGASVEIGSIVVRTNFFVIDHCTNAIILGNPFLADARANIEYSAHGLTYCRIFSEDGEGSTRFVCTKGNQVNARGIAVQSVGKGRGM